MDNYEKFVEENTKLNETYLELFKKDLTEKGLSEKTIKNHMSNAELYINDYLTYYEIIPALQGWKSVGMFFGYWFIRKALWASPANIKSTASSVKKFYKCMLENNLIEASNYEYVDYVIKEQMEYWIEDYLNLYGEKGE